MTVQPESLFQPIVSRTTTADHIVSELHRGLRAGQFPAGHVLAIPALTERFGVSRTPVREALARLVAEGVLRDDARGQVSVPAIDAAEFRKLSEARCVIEGGATQEAARLCPPSALPELRLLAERHRQTFVDGDIPAMLEANAAFHFAVYAHACNPFLMSAAERLWLRAGPYTLLLSRLLETRIVAHGLDLYSPHHDQMLAAFEAGDAAGARAEIEADIRNGAALLLPHIDDMTTNKGRPK